MRKAETLFLAALLAVSGSGCAASQESTGSAVSPASSETQPETAGSTAETESGTAESALLTIDGLMEGAEFSDTGTIQYRGDTFKLCEVSLKQVINDFGLTMLTDDENVYYGSKERNGCDFGFATVNAQTEDGAVIQLHFIYPLSDTADGLTPNYDHPEKMFVDVITLGNDFFLDENLNAKNPDEITVNNMIRSTMTESEFLDCLDVEPNKTIVQTSYGELHEYVVTWKAESIAGSDSPDEIWATADYLNDQMVYLCVNNGQFGTLFLAK